jgi:hypothetical protein
MTLEKDKNQAHYILLCSISLEPVFDYNKFLFLHTVMLIHTLQMGYRPSPKLTRTTLRIKDWKTKFIYFPAK